MMTPDYIQTLRALMEYEAARTEPPKAFPALPRHSRRALRRPALFPTGIGPRLAQVLAFGGPYR